MTFSNLVAISSSSDGVHKVWPLIWQSSYVLFSHLLSGTYQWYFLDIYIHYTNNILLCIPELHCHTYIYHMHQMCDMHIEYPITYAILGCQTQNISKYTPMQIGNFGMQSNMYIDHWSCLNNTASQHIRLPFSLKTKSTHIIYTEWGSKINRCMCVCVHVSNYFVLFRFFKPRKKYVIRYAHHQTKSQISMYKKWWIFINHAAASICNEGITVIASLFLLCDLFHTDITL